ncbi:MAG: hypothetical protein IJU12_00405, partial [Clostridia bacterium]|nr:hypothetical protein [Clostridia bacterium]
RSVSLPCFKPPQDGLETCVSYLQIEYKEKLATKQWAVFGNWWIRKPIWASSFLFFRAYEVAGTGA